MIVLGLEGTAHTISCGILDENSIMANVSSMYKPKTGGIHPTQAAAHHVDKVSEVIAKAIEIAGIKPSDIDLVAFSMGPGLGPSLRVTSTAARTLAVTLKRPIIGVNHPLGHIEIGKRLSGAQDPVMLYVSGGNTQVIAHLNGRYRVLGETLDIGIGNMIDKFARYAGIPFPGGPEIEKLAKDGRKLLTLPYSVKGMDTSFSGILTSALEYLKKGEPVEDISFSIQETAFSMLVEVLERALYVSGKDEVLMAGGVALNNRLREMVSEMGREVDATTYMTDKNYCMDNGAMIAQAGLLMYKSGIRMNIEDTSINPRYRIDEVDAPWVIEKNVKYRDAGAESRIVNTDFYGRSAVKKIRIAKGYRLKELDERIRGERMKNEFTVIRRMRDAGICVPIVYDYDPFEKTLTLSQIQGELLRDVIRARPNVMGNVGHDVAVMHKNKISHGDLTVNNIIVSDRICFIDASMGKVNAELEDLAVDVYTLEDSINSLSENGKTLMKEFKMSYRANFPQANDVLNIVEDIRRRHRYV
ncbi:O-sialoglycoprotein endopeptidase [Thermoplasma volcanium GSS1]|uniref:Probable bifunctional tRNA threonylcarbamoyladenosine biosynthesis protein n=1 Tax=Thermoplasma volcanium (strain ATCC 51530 / DSM 4299 / JCM 9571 / NBRC 15438 / GSS1) TaxID=273116 RepID=KAE1B_THEVO|nr:bifunctional N(6)-L-threonylcarbamoyladenine synthase/serine/threonine protein kinase [Thermoplasma volcanium]Q978W6.1 RecName: Full=Probable bifunctional tRNA threonylcarbamoyladenosine biosynthesis protein; Includes: RecName: Full=tRNA N6-adenosine threonylcarbamoyltransferase; AltName: Full=N6-L-threonylcarbamoyladenine synthase; Short=t(6)A synthase; AltName: Full=t(6)A37 threonylcarbamoyladenosine biosynthesis protein Kae1; AltName: Full=tRNA threonylcarbamoyladenosine biosynthesis protein